MDQSQYPVDVEPFCLYRGTALSGHMIVTSFSIESFLPTFQFVQTQVRQRASSLASAAAPEHIPHLRDAAANVER